MNYYYSFVDHRESDNNKPESKYQIVVLFNPKYLNPHMIVTSMIPIESHPLSSDEIDNWFLHTLFAQNINEIENFLDYHFNKYDGNKGGFIRHTNVIMDDYCSRKEIKSKVPIMSQSQGVEYPVNKEMKKYIEKWLEGKEDEPSVGDINRVDTRLNSNVIIKWNENSNVLTDVFRQLKNIYDKNKEPLIPNSYEELAVFLKNNFSCFSTTKISTIQTQLKNGNTRPKSDRIIEIVQTK